MTDDEIIKSVTGKARRIKVGALGILEMYDEMMREAVAMAREEGRKEVGAGWHPVGTSPDEGTVVEIAEEVDEDIWHVDIDYFDGTWPEESPTHTHWREWRSPHSEITEESK